MMNPLLKKLSLYFLLFVSAALFAPIASAQSCELDNVALQAMPDSTISVLNSKNETLKFEVRAALNNQTRAAGFQRVCAQTIADKPILFVFELPSTPNFHMRNVVASIDIAFIDEAGQVESIQAMSPYVSGSIVRPLYSPKRKVIAALEAEPGFYQEHNIEVGSIIKWSLLEDG